MPGNESVAGTRTELYVRSLLAEGVGQRQANVRDRIESLVDAGVLTDCTTTVWGRQVPVSPTEVQTDAGASIHSRISTFQQWAERNGLSLTPAFELHEVDAAMTGREYRAIRFPTVLMAEYSGRSIQCITPHADGGTVTSVTDRLDELAAGTATEFEPLPHEPSAEHATENESVTAEPAPDELESRLSLQ